MERKIITYIWKTLKILIFLSFIYTSVIMIILRSVNTAILILFAISFFIIFNKIESMNRRLKLLEETETKQEGNLCFLEHRIKELEG